jgi:hypothetical protein
MARAIRSMQRKRCKDKQKAGQSHEFPPELQRISHLPQPDRGKVAIPVHPVSGAVSLPRSSCKRIVYRGSPGITSSINSRL